MTLSSGKRERVEMNSSDMPSEKYSFAGSPLELTSGRTAIDFSEDGSALSRRKSLSVSNKTTAMANIAIIQRSTFRRDWRASGGKGAAG